MLAAVLSLLRHEAVPAVFVAASFVGHHDRATSRTPTHDGCLAPCRACSPLPSCTDGRPPPADAHRRSSGAPHPRGTARREPRPCDQGPLGLESEIGGLGVRARPWPRSGHARAAVRNAGNGRPGHSLALAPRVGGPQSGSPVSTGSGGACYDDFMAEMLFPHSLRANSSSAPPLASGQEQRWTSRSLHDSPL